MSGYCRDLLTLLISLFVLSSCTNPSGIGLDIDPEDELVYGLVDTLTLKAVTVREDSALSFSNGQGQTVFGWYHDPVIGTTVADLALAIGKPATVPRLRSDAEIDSVVLVIPYGTEYFGDTLYPNFRLQVRQLGETYRDGYYSGRAWSVNPTVIGTKSISRFTYRQNDSVEIRRHIDGRDTVVQDIPQLRIALDANFFKTLFSETIDSATMANDTSYYNHVKGLYLSVDSSAMTGIGGLVALRGISDKTGIEMVYRQHNGKDGDDAGIDTVRTFLPTTVSDSYYGTNYPRMTSTVRHTYTATVQAQLDHPDEDHPQLYLLAPAGLRARLRIADIDALKGRGLAINKAELVVYVDEEATGNSFDLQAPRLVLYREDIAGQRLPLPDGDSRSSGSSFRGDARSLWYRYGNWRAFGGELDTAQNRYVFHLTSYIQDLIQGRINSPEFFLAPAAVTDNYIPHYPILNGSGRAIIRNGDSNPALKMKLNIYYTQEAN